MTSQQAPLAKRGQLRRRTLLAATLVLAIALAVSSALWWLPGWLAKQISVRPALLSIRAVPGGDGGSVLDRMLRGQLEIRCEAWVANASWVDVSLDRVHWVARVRGREVAAGTLQPGPVLLSDREDKVEFNADVALVSLGLAVVDLLRLGSGDVDVVVDYEATALGISVHGNQTLSGFDLRVDAHAVPVAEVFHEPNQAPAAAPAAPAENTQ